MWIHNKTNRTFLGKRIKAPLPLSTNNTKCEENPCTITNGDMVGSITEFRTGELIMHNATRLKYDLFMRLTTLEIDAQTQNETLSKLAIVAKYIGVRSIRNTTKVMSVYSTMFEKMLPKGEIG